MLVRRNPPGHAAAVRPMSAPPQGLVVHPCQVQQACQHACFSKPTPGTHPPPTRCLSRCTVQDVASLGILAEKLEGDKSVLERQLAEAREAQVRGSRATV